LLAFQAKGAKNAPVLAITLGWLRSQPKVIARTGAFFAPFA
jgi:hypothetical protein